MAALLAGAALPAYAARADIEAGPAAATGAVPGTGPEENAAHSESGEGTAQAGIESVEPYKLIRSLQFVQDAVVKGDHSAMEMQRYLLEVIDERLRAADQRVFDDPRNVDAALIYAMSGGNPETLDLLALQDKFGNFDNEVTTVLRAYLDGRAAQTKTTLEEIVSIYRDSVIGPYLALVAANVTAGMNDGSSLELFDWARLTAPGTLVEEAALRRSLFIATRKGLVDKALDYANRYARRFIKSPYAGLFWGGKFGQIDPLLGFVPGLKAFVACVIGGVGSIGGAMLGGYILGLAEVLFVGLLPQEYAGYRDTFVFGLLIVILLVRPSGLLGRQTEERA